MLDLRAIEARGYPYAPFGFTSPPAVYGDLLILGPDTQEGPSTGPAGLVTAVDAITGRIVWTFSTLAPQGSPDGATWGPAGAKGRAGPAAWGDITVDPRLGLVFVPTANPADSYYGGIVPEPTFMPTRSSRSMRTPAGCAGTTSSCTMISGTPTRSVRA